MASEDQSEFLNITAGEGTSFPGFTVTDATRSMGNLRACYRDSNLEHAYCIYLVLHSNASLAFNDELIDHNVLFQ